MAAKQKSSKSKRSRKRSPPRVSRSSRVFWISGAVILVVVVFAVVRKPSGSDAPASSRPKGAELAAEKLIGRWQRPDGGYVIEIRSAQADGSFDASYFNPRSINVSRAEWSREDGRLRIFVELTDVNYPGSNYTLEYSPARWASHHPHHFSSPLAAGVHGGGRRGVWFGRH